MRLDQIASSIQADLDGDSEREIDAVRPLDTAGPRELAFISAELRRTPDLSSCHAGALIVSSEFDRGSAPSEIALLRVPETKLAWARAIELLHPEPEPPFDGVSSDATVDPEAQVGEGARIAPYCFVAAGAKIGARTVLYPGCFVGPHAEIGEDCLLHPGVTVYAASRIGNRCILHSGSVIGSDGFGYALGPMGAYKVPHRGGCILEDQCEIGANTTIDRGALDDTVVKTGTKLDNLVQIAHNCHVGPHAFFASQAGIAGSASVGMGVQVGGQAGLGGHIEIGDGSRVGGKAGVHHDLPPGSRVLGSPAMEQRQAARVFAAMPKLPELRAQVNALEKRIAELEAE
ncbi:MAG: UDP-3-O-(3-hydroxymyristoyl)glucosamine N-acyltransferase [Planctomycetota bacterium]